MEKKDDNEVKEEKKSWADQEEEEDLAQKLGKAATIPKETAKDEDGLLIRLSSVD
jgi:hypothetical protein